MEELLGQPIRTLLDNNPVPEKSLPYGTAGFRGAHQDLDAAATRMALLAVFRSLHQNNKAVGIIVTASHNPPQDNGLKMVDASGSMLEQSWEKYATRIANAPTTEKALEELKSVVSAEDITLRSGVWSKVSVVLGGDTRESTERLLGRVKDVLVALKTNIIDLGTVPTPQVHHVVYFMNQSSNGSLSSEKRDWYKQFASVNGYFKMMAQAVHQLLPQPSQSPVNVHVDCSHGVGSFVFPALRKHLEEAYTSPPFEFTVHNPAEKENASLLNEGCGAEFVQKQATAPKGMDPEGAKQQWWCSFDGDADRIIFHFYDQEKKWHMLDGDRIATLVARHFSELLRQCQIKLVGSDETPSGDALCVGVVQTAYANGNSTAYLNEQAKIPVAVTPTGVKHLHHKALDFDIGVYFEANGHGTVVFSQRAEDLLSSKSSSEEATIKSAAKTMLAFIQLVNQSVGDAVADMLMVLVILAQSGRGMPEWIKEYTELPSIQAKLPVNDRTKFKTNADETRLVEPSSLQSKIDELVKEVPQGRAFIRPSGTENVVRIYAEAQNREDVDKLTKNLSSEVESLGY